MKNTKNTIHEMQELGFVVFNTREYRQMQEQHNWVKLGTLVKNGVLKEVACEQVIDVLRPEEMADFVNELAGDDLYDAHWEFRWNNELMMFEEVERFTRYYIA